MQRVEAGLKRTRARLPFTDFARGIVMVLMAWDHVSSFWNLGKRGGEVLMGRRLAREEEPHRLAAAVYLMA